VSAIVSPLLIRHRSPQSCQNSDKTELDRECINASRGAMPIDASRGSMDASTGPSMHPGGLCLSMHSGGL